MLENKGPGLTILALRGGVWFFANQITLTGLNWQELMINQNKSKQTYGSLIKVVSVSIVAMSCFVLGAFVGRYFGDKQDSYNSEEIQNTGHEGAAEPNKRSLASAETEGPRTGGQVIIVGKKPSPSFKDTTRKIASVDDSYSDDEANTDKYTIAITQYERRDMAIIHIEELRSQGFIESFYVKVEKEEDQPMYQVNIGLFESRQDATNKKNSLSQIIDLSNATIKLQKDSIIKINYD